MMDSSPEMERFSVSDADYEFMMDPLQRRPKQSRKQRIYGVFASDDSDSDEERSGFGGRDAGFKRKGANYSAPITFVSGGVKAGDRGRDEDGSQIHISDDDEDINLVKEIHGSDSDSSEDTRPHRSSRRQPMLQVGAGRRAAVAAAASRSESGGFGAWERHTKGIGMKLLEQMGYQPGKGLGCEGQGITTPVQATQRAGKAAVGYFGSEAAPAPRRGNEVGEKDTESESAGGPRYKKKSGKIAKPSYKYVTADEVVASVSPSTPAAAVKRHGLFLENSEMSKVKVIDMTTKEKKIYSGYEAALSRTVRSSRKPESGTGILEDDGPDAETRRMEKRREGQLFDCPALRHNLGLILRSGEEEIRKLDRTARFEEDRCVALEHEIDKLTEVVSTQSVEVKRLQKALNLIKEFESEVDRAKGDQSIDDIGSWMTRIREECADLPEMPVMLAAVARPMLDSSLSKWKPLVDPSFCFQLLSKWKDSFQNSSAFDVILETSWLNTLRRTIVNDWDPRDCESLLDVLEAWKPLLSEEMLEQRILNQLVLPKIQEAVFSWNPLTDTVPIHTWLHPWLPWFGGAERLSAVHDAVLQKLGMCFNNWHPSDGSAHSVLTPWRSVVPVSSMVAFLNRHVVPKLGLALQQFKLNPAAQNMDVWNWVMRWADLIGPAVVVNLLEQHFWSRWLSVLSNWLNQGVEARQQGNPQAAGQVFQEVGRWYAGWKGQLPPECMEYASVKDALTRALAMMERAMRGLPPQEPKPSGATASADVLSHYSLPMGGVPQTSSFAAAPLVAPPPTTLRKQVEQVAAQRGLVFHPIVNRMFEGQQVYRLESLQVIFDRNVSFVFNATDGGWHPVSFSELMSKAEYG